MIEQDRPDRRKLPKIILAGRVIAVPGDDVERRLADLGDVKTPTPFHDERARRRAIFEGRNRGLKVPRIGKPVRPYGASLRQGESCAVVLANVAA